MNRSIRTLVFLSSALFLLVSCSGSGEKSGPAASRKEARLASHDLHDAVTLLGVLEPKNQILLKSEVSGIVTQIHVTEGAVLKKGTPILTIDPRPYDNAKVKLTLQRKKVQLEYGILQREFEKDSALSLEGAVSARKLQDQRDNLELKSIQRDEIDIDIKDVNEKLEKTILVAPINGMLLSLDTKVGEIVVSATTGYSAGTVAGTLANTDSMQVICHINEVDYHAIRPATPVSVYLETDPSARAEGRIAFISRNAKLEENKSVRSFEVRVDVTKLHPKMVPGINVSVEFTTLDKKGVLALPCAFITEKPGSGAGVLVKEGTAEKERSVKTGATDYKFTEILEGLSDKDIVLEPVADKAE
ncbi:MAG: efflux RND transporter periplasmic adaptor subunit [Fibrobacterota bacterium]